MGGPARTAPVSSSGRHTVSGTGPAAARVCLDQSDCPGGSGGWASGCDNRPRDPRPARGARPARRPQANAAGRRKPFHVPDVDARPRSPRAPYCSSFSLGQAGHPGRAEENQARQTPGQRGGAVGQPDRPPSWLTLRRGYVRTARTPSVVPPRGSKPSAATRRCPV